MPQKQKCQTSPTYKNELLRIARRLIELYFECIGSPYQLVVVLDGIEVELPLGRGVEHLDVGGLRRSPAGPDPPRTVEMTDPIVDFLSPSARNLAGSVSEVISSSNLNHSNFTDGKI